jgi:hypothetical protein
MAVSSRAKPQFWDLCEGAVYCELGHKRLEIVAADFIRLKEHIRFVSSQTEIKTDCRPSVTLLEKKIGVRGGIFVQFLKCTMSAS